MFLFISRVCRIMESIGINRNIGTKWAKPKCVERNLLIAASFKFNLELWLHDMELQIVQFLDRTKYCLAFFPPISERSHRSSANHSLFLQFILEGYLGPRKEVGFLSPTECLVIEPSIFPLQLQRLNLLGQSLNIYILHS